MHEPFAEDELESEFAGTLAKFARDAQKDEIQALTAKVQSLGMAGLSSEEKSPLCGAVDRAWRGRRKRPQQRVKAG
jgi:plasmid stabilization system protein ParE